MDMFTKDIVGYAISDTLETVDRLLKAQKMAAKTMGGMMGVIAYSDQGASTLHESIAYYWMRLDGCRAWRKSFIATRTR